MLKETPALNLLLYKDIRDFPIKGVYSLRGCSNLQKHRLTRLSVVHNSFSAYQRSTQN